MSPNLANFLFEAANFLLLAAGLGWALFKPIRKALDAERARHAKETEDATRVRAELESSAERARDERAAASRELASLRSESIAAARKEAARILEEARTAQASERRTLEHDLEAARETEALELTEEIARIAAESVKRLLSRVRGPALDLALVRAACEELAPLPSSSRSAALVETARELEPEAKRLLESVLGGELRARIVADLGAGVRVTTSVGQVDSTVLSITRAARRAMTAAIAEGLAGKDGAGG